MNWRSIIAAAPLMVAPVLMYNLFAALLPGGFHSAAANDHITSAIWRLTTATGGVWPISGADLLLACTLVVLFLELVKSTASRRIALINHGLSLVLFIVCLAELLLAPAFATSTFFLVTLMVLLDVLFGFMVTIASARRENDPPWDN